ncbi:hypothetical protein [Natrinema sp. CBA1119]|uniref:hypothetical protein n=1 Tax=Natrinema sp. CBA1119 TaxID=1608465 RepID=UPI00159BE8F3|nr:hypothetical protein [Natrinema sp. CBA1119]
MSVQTADLEGAAEAVPSHPTVHDVRLVDRRDYGGRRKLEIVLGPRVDRIPPGVLRTLAEHDCGVGLTQPQGMFLVAEVR